MNTYPLSRIKILPNRQRKTHDPDLHRDLVESIMERQLQHPPVLRTHEDGLALVAGERRLRAIEEIFELGGQFRCNGQVFDADAGLIPYTHLGDLSPLEAEEAELEENIQRSDLSWQERAEVEARLMSLRTLQNSEKLLPPPTTLEIAKETRGAATPALATAVSRNVVLANNLHRPEVRTAKTATDAMKTLLRIEEAERNQEKAATMGKEFLGGKHTLFNTDSIEWMREQPSAQFDVICTDPPYGMGADEFGDSGGGAEGAHFYSDSPEEWERLMSTFIPESFRLTKPDAHFYLFCDFDKFTLLREMASLVGWTPFRTPLIWYKPSAFRAPWPAHGPQRKYECILYARKGDLKTTKLGGDVLIYPPDVNLGHQAQKPIALYQDLLSRSVRPGMKVLDPFCGTGPIFPAAHSLSAIATGVELDPAAYAIAATRLETLRGK